MKKIFLVAVVFLMTMALVAVVVVKVSSGNKKATTEENVPEIEISKRPFVTLIPSDDGHWLKMVIDKLVIKAQTLDYDLVYELPDGASQGTGGTIKLAGNEKIERDLLLGSESSGKYYYDNGVEKGTLSFKFKDEKGKTVAKFTADFALYANKLELNSIDNKFKYILDKQSKDYFIIMNTIGYSNDFDKNVIMGPYGVFSSSEADIEGQIIFDGGTIYLMEGEAWIRLDETKDVVPGVFLLANE